METWFGETDWKGVKMFHYRCEGREPKSGLNVTVGKGWKWPWISFQWLEIDPNTYEAFGWYFRIRTLVYPFIIFDRIKYNIIEHALWHKNLYAITREEYEDYVVEGRLKTQANLKRTEEHNKKN
jgi:hypothetical protein